MINITESPDGVAQNTDVPITKPRPYSPYDCIDFCFQPDSGDVFETVGSTAKISIEFGGGVLAPVDGTEFTLQGNTLTMDSAHPFSSTSFRVETGDGIQTGLNFRGMIQANFFLSQSINANIISQSGGTMHLDLDWKTCGEQAKFSGSNMDLQPLESQGMVIGFFLNGTSPVYKEGFQLITRLNMHESVFEDGIPITSFEGLNLPKQCSEVGAVCINYADDIWQQINCPIPSLTELSGTTRELMRLFSVSFGSVYRVDCQPQSGEINQSDLFLAIAGYQPDDDRTDFSRYWANHDDGHPNGLNVVEFLTTQPKRYEICRGTVAWLWLLNNWQSSDDTYNLRAKFVGRRWLAGNVVSISTPQFIDLGNGYFAYDLAMWFSVTPKNIATLFGIPLEDLHSYDVSVEMWTTGGVFEKVVTETISYFLEGCDDCNEETDIYFVTPAGGIGTLPVLKTSESADQSGDSIVLPRGCFSGLNSRGQVPVNLKNVSKFGFQVKLDNTPENRRWIKHFAFSPNRWVKTQKYTFTDEPFSERLYLDSNSIKVRESDEFIKWEFDGYTGDVPSQKIYQ